jgi:hypothetical protein
MGNHLGQVTFLGNAAFIQDAKQLGQLFYNTASTAEAGSKKSEQLFYNPGINPS